jgi:hypothetical protein
MSVMKLRIEIERTLRDFVAARGIESKRPTGIGLVLRDLKQRGIAPPSTDRFLDALRVMNDAAHGFDVEPEAVEQVVSIGAEFLAELQTSASDVAEG